MLGGHTTLFLQVKWYHKLLVAKHLVLDLPLMSLLLKYLGFGNQIEVHPLI